MIKTRKLSKYSSLSDFIQFLLVCFSNSHLSKKKDWQLIEDRHVIGFVWQEIASQLHSIAVSETPSK